MKQSLEELLQTVASSRHRYHNLVKIRVEFVKDSQGINNFIEKEGVQTCLSLLKDSDEKCIEVILSILGNACMNKEATIIVMKKSDEVISHLGTMLIKANTICKTRIFRLTGNLMLNMEDNFIRLEEIQHAICVTLEQVNVATMNDSDIEMLTMLTRAVRLFWKCSTFANSFIATETIRKIMNILVSCFRLKQKDDGARPESKRPKFERVYTFPKPERACQDTLILEKESEEIVIDKKHATQLVESIIKLISTVTIEYKNSVVDQVLCDRETAKTVIRLLNSKYQSTVLRIFAQFSGHPILVEAMGLFDAATLLSNIILNVNTSKGDLKNCILILSTMTNQSGNRLKIRQSGSLGKLISIAAETQDEEEIKLIMFTLYQFRFDPLSLDCMVKYGVVKVLTRHIETSLNQEFPASNHSHESPMVVMCGDDNKQKETCTKALKKTYLPILDYGNIGYRSMGSPCSSSGYSSEEYENTSMKYDYSPVCSDTEEDRDVLIPEQPPIEPIFDFTTLMQDDDNEDESNISIPDANFTDHHHHLHHYNHANGPVTEFEEFKKIYLICLLKLLVEISRQRIVCQQDLVSERTLQILVKGFDADVTIFVQITKILKNILSDIKYYVAIIHQTFIYDLFEKRFNESCIKNCDCCRQISLNIISIINCLSLNAISGYGIGEIRHLYNKSDVKSKLQGAIMSMYLIKCKKELESLLIGQKAFDIMIEYIQEFPTEKMSLYVVNGFTMMGMNLQIVHSYAVPALASSSEIPTKTFNESDWKDTNTSPRVTFVVSEGYEIAFNKSILIRLSEVFRTMFHSSFREANDHKVNLNYISRSALKYFLSLLLIEAEETEEGEDEILTSTMEDLLQAYQLSRLYLLVSIEQKLFNLIVKTIDFDNVHLVMKFSLEYCNEGLFDSASTYYISSDIIAHQKLAMFKRANSSQFREQWIEKLKEIIMYYCNE